MLIMFSINTIADDNSEEIKVYNINKCVLPVVSGLISKKRSENEINEIYQGIQNGEQYSVEALYSILLKDDPVLAICWLKNLADTGSTEYQNKLAYELARGDKKIKNISQSINLYNQVLAKEPENLAANLTLGVFYANGYGVPKDDVQAFDYFLKASNTKNANSPNYPMALLKVGNAYQYGVGTAKDTQKALTYYQSILTKNYEEFLNEVTELSSEEQFLVQAQMYDTGLGGVKDIKKAADNYYLAAIEGNNFAQYKMSKLYEEGQGVPKDTDNATAWLEAAKLNDTIEAYYF